MKVFKHIRPKFSLSQRIFLLSLAPIMGLLIVFAVEQITSRRIVAADAAHDLERRAADRLLALQADFTIMRQAVDDFRISGSKVSEQEFRTMRNAVTPKLASLGQRVNETSRTEFEKLTREAAEFSTNFEQLISIIASIGRTENDGLIASLNNANQIFNGNISSKNTELANWHQPLISIFNSLILVEKNYRINFNNANTIKFADTIKRLHGIIKIVNLNQSDRKELIDNLESYEQKFLDLVDTTQASQSAFNRVRSHYVVLGQMLQKMRGEAEDRAGQALSYTKQIDSERQWYLFTTLAGVIAFSLVMVTILGHQLSHSIQHIASAMRSLSTGAIQGGITTNTRIVEIRDMTTALNVFRDNALERQALTERQSAQAQTEALRVRSIERVIGQFEASVETSLGQLNQASSLMQEVSTNLDGLAEGAEAQAISAAGETDRAAHEIEAASVASQQLSGSVQEVASQALRSDQVAAHALEEAERANQAMQGLIRQTERVGEIVGLIDTIASQTNLLALNATIEAARAGEAGRGFAVVASEVKGLAAQTAKATAEIGEQIAGMRAASQGASDAIGLVNATITEVSRIASSVAAAVEEQSASLDLMAHNVAAASQGASRGATGIRDVKEAVSSTIHSAAKVAETAEIVSREATTLQEQIRWFLKEVRAA